MMNRAELENKRDEMSDKSNSLSQEDWKDAYMYLYEINYTRRVLDNYLKEVIIEKYGGEAYEDLWNDAVDQVNEKIRKGEIILLA